MSEKLFTQILLGLTLVFSVAIFLAALNVIGPSKIEAWAVLVAVLAVLSSVVSAWSSYRVVDLQKEAIKPHVTISYDFESRYDLAQLKLKNTGGSAAKNIKIDWTRKLKDHNEEEITFGSTDQNFAISHLAQGEEINRIIDVGFKFFERYENTKISGNISYNDLNDNKISNRFEISAEHFRGSPTYSNEELKTNYEIQKIPKSLDQLTKQIDRLTSSLRDIDK